MVYVYILTGDVTGYQTVEMVKMRNTVTVPSLSHQHLLQLLTKEGRKLGVSIETKKVKYQESYNLKDLFNLDRYWNRK
jgi:hypothetical protein